MLSATPSFQPKALLDVAQETEECDLHSGNIKKPRTHFEWAQMLDLVDKDFKTAIMKMFKELKENMLKS